MRFRLRRDRVIAFRGVATDERPARLIAVVGVAAMQRVAMKKQGVARFHFAVDQFKTRRQRCNTIRVCAGLCADCAVLGG